ncbi:dienelactone hydrolase family protein [Sinorhizobium sp. 7-81]|uniref:dienelactone hydrolase family protein n=1 Tax=Sinorhizobium sp. 8-89 TaxID=3049089 RepID=UPI0024C446F5|nr:alpha/beta family hydrolase [Sinorhizobium sp. 8-89]MDK1491214.1 dienelactone hydrolase family protein [Sinorhizobium sp. 8-89]
MTFGTVQLTTNGSEAIAIEISPHDLPGCLRLPSDPRGVVVFAHGCGSNRESPRNVYVAEVLRKQGFATVVFDLLSEQEAANRVNVFDIPLLTKRMVGACRWALAARYTRGLPVGLFGASTGAAAALQAAAELGDQVSALVSRGGRPDLASALEEVRTPTLLIVGGSDRDILGLNRAALAMLSGPKKLQIVPDATHLFSEPGALDAVAAAAAEWFGRYCGQRENEQERR